MKTKSYLDNPHIIINNNVGGKIYADSNILINDKGGENKMKIDIEKRVGIRWEVLVNGKIRAGGITFKNRIFRTLKDKANYEAICFISWLKGTTEYEELLKSE